jgi:hypothetical protein
MTLRTTPRPFLCAGRSPGDRSGLARAPRARARAMPWGTLPLASATATAPPTHRPLIAPSPLYRPARTPRPVVLPGPSFKPHSGSPAPRFCPTDL